MTDLNFWIQVIIILLFWITSSFFYIRENGWDFDYEYVLLVLMSVLTGGSFYAGLVWALKPFNLLPDNSIYSNLVYNLLIGFILMAFAIISIKKWIEDS